ncbi:MAG: glycosyltransferase [Promethearchaeota archaeon]
MDQKLNKNLELFPMDPVWILYLGTFPPRECGIATFTENLTSAMDEKFFPYIKSKIIALNDKNNDTYDYPDNVIFEINDSDISSYIEVAQKINEIDKIKLINIQHEFGIFGGEYGKYLISFIKHIKKPVVITFHSIIPNANKKLKKIVRILANKAKCIIVMAKIGINILRDDYGIEDKIIFIPHGTPNVPFISNSNIKKMLGYDNKIILSSFGMMNSGKGYEYILEALPEIIKQFPNVVYLIIGATHPVVKYHEGEKYRKYLEEKVIELGLQNNVIFNNKYLTVEEVIRLLIATDIYISSSLNPNQIVSGTLAYAMACGKVVISTPFLHALDVITPEKGILVKFRDSKSYADAILKVLSNPELKKKLERNVYECTRNTIWPNVALTHFKLFSNIITEIKSTKMAFPKITLKYLKKLTDNFGMIQFAKYSTPDKLSGYTLDDNARALLAFTMHYNLFKDSNNLEYIQRYLEFINYTLKNDNKMYNVVDCDRNIKQDGWSEDAHGRAMWALGYLISSKKIPENLKKKGRVIFEKGLNVVNSFKSPRAIAFIIIGLYFYSKEYEVKSSLIQKFADFLIGLYKNSSNHDWKWFEKYLTYSNSKLSESLMYAFKATNNRKYLKIATISLEFLINNTFTDDKFAPIGQNGWYFKGQPKAEFDQQPVDVASTVQTLIVAYKITKEEKYLKQAIIAFEWFLGRNHLNQVVYDETTGGCCDGIKKFSVNMNQGAESSISYLLARLTLEKFEFLI